MGCFLGCFGASKDQKRKKRNKFQPRNQRNASCNLVQSAVSSVQVECEKPITSVSEVRDNPEEQSNSSIRKKVTFDSNVTTYEKVSTNEEEFGKNKEEKNLAKFSPPKCSSEDSSVSLGSYPPNHRYQNCRDSNDDEELDLEDSDIDEEDENDDYEDDDDGELEYKDEIIESKRGIGTNDEASSPWQPVNDFPEKEVKQTGLNCNARDRSAYVHSVLNPVENLTQWRAVKVKGAALVKPRKENSTLDQEPRISFSSTSSFKVDKPKQPKQEIAVDASLSNWLVYSEATPPVNKTTSTFGLDATPVTSEGSNSMKSKEDRPILGALTVEELRQFSVTSSPRKSPSKSPDEMSIVGTVGTYWNHKDSLMDFDSASSFKGIPNTTSKYREDKIVNWHATPFETRLERALRRGVGEADSTQKYYLKLDINL